MINVSVQSLIRVAALACGLIGAATDLRSRRIPNWLTGPTMLAGVLLHFLTSGWKEGIDALLGLLLCGGVFMLFYLAGGMGAGDVKLIAAEASLLGLPNSGALLLYTALCGGVMAFALAVQSGRLRDTVTNVAVLLSHHRRNGLQPHPELNVTNQSTLRLPYALAIACGCALTLWLQPATWCLQ